MTSDIRQPADDSRLHDDPAELARLLEQSADTHMQGRCKCRTRKNCDAVLRLLQEKINDYRRLAARGETVPRF